MSHTPSHASSSTSTPVPLIALSSVGAAAQPDASGVKVFVRVRPFNEREKAQGAQLMAPIVKVDAAEPSHITLLDPKHDMRPKETYTFDHCFWSVVSSNDPGTAASSDGCWTPRPTSQPPFITPPYASQADVYDLVGHSVLCNAIEGFNGCIFAYGQTGSGKTFTMMGYEPNTPPVVNTPLSRQPSSAILPGGSLATSRRGSTGPATPRGMTPSNSESVLGAGGEDWETAKGIIPRIASEIFEALSVKHSGDSSHSFRVELQYYEIYNEKVYDLFEPSNSNELRVRQDPLRGPFVDQLTMKCVDNQEAIAKLIKKGSHERHTAATKANERSSRSHAILTLTLVQMVLDENDCPQKMVSKVNLVDLAGSERTGLTGAEGQRFTEATKINLSLTTLGRVIDCLADQSTGKANGFTHCPYRESLLTWLLMDSIGGNSKTTMIATISPSMLNQEEIVQTLRYASRARQIVNKVVVNEDPQTRRMKELAAEVERLGRIIAEAQMCPYSIQFVSELEENYRAAQGEITHLRENNTSLRCEVDILQKKKSLKPAVSADEDLGNQERGASPTHHIHQQRQRSESSSPLPSMGGMHPIHADPNIAGPKRLFERSEAIPNPSLQFTGSPMENCLRYRVRELTQAMQTMLTQQRSGVAASALRRQPHGGAGDTSIDSIASSAVSFDFGQNNHSAHEDSGGANVDDDIMSVEYVHMIEKLAQQLEQSEAALLGLTKTQMDVFHSDMKGIRDEVASAEREHRERITAVASAVRSDIKSLIFRSNAATEKMIGDKAKESAAKKHAAEIQQLEDRWESRLAECRESFAAQIAEERSNHDVQLRQVKEASAKEHKKVQNKEEERSRTGVDAQKTIEDLQARLDAATLTHQKQLAHVRTQHDKEKKKWEEEMESKETRAGDMMRIAVADAHAKGRAAVEESKKKKEAVAAERDCLAKRLAVLEEQLTEMTASADAQKQALAKREKQLQDWQRSLQTVEARELHTVTEQLTMATRAREASHARHEDEVDSTKSMIEQLTHSHQQAMAEVQYQHTARLETLENRICDLSYDIDRLSVAYESAQATLEQRASELSKANDEINHLRGQLLVASETAFCQGIAVEEVRQQRATSQSRHESASENLQQAHQAQISQITSQLEGKLQTAAIEHDAALKALAALSDARVERLTSAVQNVECARVREQRISSLTHQERDMRDVLVISWFESLVTHIIIHERSTGKKEGDKQTIATVASMLECSERSLEQQLERHTSTVDGMMSTMLSSLRQLRWHQESMLSDARDAIIHEMGKHKSAMLLWVEHEQSQLAASLSQLHRQSYAGMQSAAGCTEEEQGRRDIEHLADHSRQQLYDQWVTGVHQSAVAKLLEAYRDVQHTEWMASVEFLLVHQCQTTQELYQQLYEDQTMSAEQREIIASLRHQITTLNDDAEARHSSLVSLHHERDALAETARALELRLGEANLEVLEADLLCSQLKDEREQVEQQRRSESETNTQPTGIVGSLVRRLWSVSQGRSAPSAERDNSRHRTSSQETLHQPTTPRLALPLQRIGSSSSSFSYLPSAVPFGVHTPRTIPTSTAQLATPRRAPVIIGNPNRLTVAAARAPYSQQQLLFGAPNHSGGPHEDIA
jgi:hypothetical protein